MNIEQKHFFDKEIRDFLNEVNGMNFIMLCTSDGFEISLATKKHIENSGKIAAVSSSILAMISAFTSEIQLVGCRTITLDAEDGKVFLTSVSHPTYPMVLVATTKTEVLLGQVLYALKRLSENLATIEINKSPQF